MSSPRPPARLRQAHDLADLPEELPEEPGRGSREVARLLGEVGDDDEEAELAEMEEDFRRKHSWGGREGCQLARPLQEVVHACMHAVCLFFCYPSLLLTAPCLLPAPCSPGRRPQRRHLPPAHPHARLAAAHRAGHGAVSAALLSCRFLPPFSLLPTLAHASCSGALPVCAGRTPS